MEKCVTYGTFFMMVFHTTLITTCSLWKSIEVITLKLVSIPNTRSNVDKNWHLTTNTSQKIFLVPLLSVDEKIQKSLSHTQQHALNKNDYRYTSDGQAYWNINIFPYLKMWKHSQNSFSHVLQQSFIVPVLNGLRIASHTQRSPH